MAACNITIANLPLIYFLDVEVELFRFIQISYDDISFSFLADDRVKLFFYIASQFREVLPGVAYSNKSIIMYLNNMHLYPTGALHYCQSIY